jgi:hypothetical protein
MRIVEEPPTTEQSVELLRTSCDMHKFRPTCMHLCGTLEPKRHNLLRYTQRWNQ